MARVPFTTAETTARRFVRQLFMRKIKDNDDDHEARILQVEGPLRMFDHFNHSSIASELQLNDHTLHPQTFDYTKWQTRAGGGESVNANADLSNLAFNAFPVTRQGFSLQDNPAPEFSVKRMYADDSNTGGLAATTFVNARSILTFQHDKVVLPITVEWRARWHLGVQTSSITRNKFLFGMGEPTLLRNLGGGFSNNWVSGIWLERHTQADVRFVSRNGANLFVGTVEFAKPLPDTWFGVKIEFDTAEARCFFDDGGGFVLKETISQHLPTTAVLTAAYASNFNAGVEDGGGSGLPSIDFDLCDWKCLGLLPIT